ncbi:hypothetical protein HDU97_008807 [Phlyctochytrium planicorne]|nr:hypothetical protein HDU97_008807 [Phlyctochytrium planicorne]
MTTASTLRLPHTLSSQPTSATSTTSATINSTSSTSPSYYNKNKSAMLSLHSYRHSHLLPTTSTSNSTFCHLQGQRHHHPYPLETFPDPKERMDLDDAFKVAKYCENEEATILSSVTTDHHRPSGSALPSSSTPSPSPSSPPCILSDIECGVFSPEIMLEKRRSHNNCQNWKWMVGIDDGDAAPPPSTHSILHNADHHHILDSSTTPPASDDEVSSTLLLPSSPPPLLAPSSPLSTSSSLSLASTSPRSSWSLAAIQNHPHDHHLHLRDPTTCLDHEDLDLLEEDEQLQQEEEEDIDTISRTTTTMSTPVTTTSSPAYIPPELLSQIFSFVPISSLPSCSLVSRAWHHLANQSLYLAPPSDLLVTMMNALACARMKRVESVARVAEWWTTDHDECSSTSSRSSNDLDRIGLEMTVHLPWPARYLRTLTFPETYEPVLNSMMFLSLISVHLSPLSTNITSLVIPDVAVLSPRVFVELLRACPGLKQIELGGWKVDDEVLGWIGRLCEGVRRVRIGNGTGVTAEGVLKMVKGLERIERLECEGVKGWHESLDLVRTIDWTHLTHLSIHLCDIKSTLLLAIVATPGGGQNLVSINIGNLSSLHPPTVELSLESVDVIAGRCRRLRELCLGDGWELGTWKIAERVGEGLRSLKVFCAGRGTGGVTDCEVWKVAERCRGLEVLRIVFGDKGEEGEGPEEGMEVEEGGGASEEVELMDLDDGAVKMDGSLSSFSGGGIGFNHALPISPPLSPSLTSSTPLPIIPPTTQQHLNPTTITPTSLIHILTRCTNLRDVGFTGSSAPVTPGLLSALASAPCARRIEMLSFAGVQGVEVDDVLDVCGGLNRLRVLEVPWVGKGVVEGGRVERCVKGSGVGFLDLRGVGVWGLDDEEGEEERGEERTVRMVNGKGGECDVVLAGW